MVSLIKDVRYACRRLVRQPSFTLVTVITLALGIGANTAIFSVVYSVLLKPLPFYRADRIVVLWGEDRSQGTSRNQVSHTDIVDYRKQQTAFESITTFTNWTPLLSGTGEPVRINAAWVGDDFFNVMGTQPFLGRAFLPEEQEDGKDMVVVLSYELWQRQLNSDPNAVGKTILLNLRPYTIVGVMPANAPSLPATLLDKPALLYRPVAEQANEGQQPEFHVMAVRPPFDAHVFERDRDLPACAKFDRDSLVRNPAVADGVVQGVVQQFGRCQHVINQAECAKVIIARQAKSQQVVAQRVGGEFEKFDLAPHLDAGAAVIDLLDAQPCLRQQRCGWDAAFAQACVYQAGDAA